MRGTKANKGEDNDDEEKGPLAGREVGNGRRPAQGIKS